MGGRGWGPDLVWMLRGRPGFIFIAPSHSRTTMVSSTASSRRRGKEEMEEIGRNVSTNYNAGVRTTTQEYGTIQGYGSSKNNIQVLWQRSPPMNYKLRPKIRYLTALGF